MQTVVRPKASAELIPLTGDRTAVAYELWCAYIGGQSPEPMQLDRWGPGLPVLVDAGGRPVEEHPDGYELTPTEPGQAVRGALERITEAPGCGGILAYRDERAVGLVVYATQTHPFLTSSTGVIELIFVVPDARRRGIGSLLVSTARDELRRSGIHSISVEIPNESREARRFWRRAGWQEHAVVGYHYD